MAGASLGIIGIVSPLSTRSCARRSRCRRFAGGATRSGMTWRGECASPDPHKTHIDDDKEHEQNRNEITSDRPYMQALCLSRQGNRSRLTIWISSPLRERRGPIAQQWRGEGAGAASSLAAANPSPSPLRGSLLSDSRRASPAPSTIAQEGEGKPLHPMFKRFPCLNCTATTGRPAGLFPILRREFPD